MAKTQQHVHKLRRHTFKTGNTVYFCALPDCTFKINTALALGKRTICWRCGAEFILSEYSVRLAKPHCDACHKPKKLSYDAETTGIDVLSIPNSAIPIEPLSGQRVTPAKTVVNDLKTRLTGVIHGSLAAKPDEEEGEI